MLPELFLQRMEQMLGDEFDDFLQSYDREKTPSLRINLQKDKEQKLLEKVDFILKPVPWAKGGFYYDEGKRPGKHPFHEAGVYYIQEASAMAPAEGLHVQPGELVLDLCAAPGGKSTQLAAAMQGEGILICNEIHPARAKILSENIERMGITNAIVTNHDPATLAEHFQGCFDRILVDAPCSGEGMFRKNENAAGEWSPENVELCAARQDDILASAAKMLKPGGHMVYSTCTFAPSEDEGTVSRFVAGHSDFIIEEMERAPGMAAGEETFAQPRIEGIAETTRLWPHRLDGEGHFMAALTKKGTAGLAADSCKKCFWTLQKEIKLRECGEWEQFQKDYIKKPLDGIYLKFGEQLYLAPRMCPSLQGLKVLRPGLHLGTLKKNRFEPAHALALALQSDEVLACHDLTVAEAAAYIQGQTFRTEGKKGWYLITVEGYSLGWGKLADHTMKNHYPKGLRK